MRASLRLHNARDSFIIYLRKAAYGGLKHFVCERIEHMIDAATTRLMANVLLEVGGARIGKVFVGERREAFLQIVALLLRADRRINGKAVVERNRNRCLADAA